MTTSLDTGPRPATPDADEPTGSASVVICTHTWRRLDQVKACVDSILGGTVAPQELIVVVDNNPDLREHLAGALPDGVMLMDSDGRGASEARNTGLAKTSGDVVAFIDDDATADPAWLAELLRGFQALPSAIALGGRILPNYEARDGWLPDELLWLVGCTYAGHPTESRPIGRPIGCNMAFRREALQRAGGFNKDFGPGSASAQIHFNEEIILGKALQAIHGPDAVWYWPGAVVHHLVPADRVSWAYLVSRCIAEGRSKADVRRLHGNASLGYDAGYVVRTLLPAIGLYGARAVRGPDADAARKAALAGSGLLITAAAYGERSAMGLVKRAR